ncbi:Kef family K(+) transporter [Pseudogemmatithrix spongiicola]|uniref:Kef family K(+) transporter n=1 Tax=Pseudogemmatithrix spongiicola TaxID=3062599 RepID=A0AA49JX46_9BACT|nr:Kef family K(+) transporter [Gemmatimonadaceae bacterium 'strain 138']WKW16580.1 Kef family K(+) transporter [Gemmatimonadaceae bacterium 'strain 318']
MPHSVSLISTIAGAFVLALILGYIAVRLRMPALVGYLVAGVVMGPFTPGFTGDLELIQQLAEIGVMLLMFGVGMHLSLEDLLSVRRIAVPGAVLQIAVATGMGYAVAHYWWGWDVGAGLVFGLSLSVASTVVLLRALEARGSLETLTGRIAVGWLVVEDIAMVVALVLLPPLAAALTGDGTLPGESLGKQLALTLGSVVLFVVLMFVVGRRLFPWILLRIAGTGSRELFTLAVMAAGVGIAYAAGVIFGVSYALGAFFAGMVMRESEFSHRAADESLPFRDAFAVLFFVSVGMLFNPALLWQEPLKILTVLFIIIIGKSIAAFGLVLMFRYPLNTALTVSAALAQIGEFSFILAGMGVSLGLLSLEGQNLILAGAVVSIALNPVIFSAIEPARQWILKRSRLARHFARPNDRLAELPHSYTPAKLTNHLLIVGYGRVGRRIGEALTAQGLTFVVAEQNREIVARLRSEGIAAVAGDATEPEVLIQAHVARARALVIATPDTVGVKAIMDIAHRLRPELPVIVRTHGDKEAEELRHEPRVEVFMGEEELAKAMIAALLREVRPSAQAS